MDIHMRKGRPQKICMDYMRNDMCIIGVNTEMSADRRKQMGKYLLIKKECNSSIKNGMKFSSYKGLTTLH